MDKRLLHLSPLLALMLAGGSTALFTACSSSSGNGTPPAGDAGPDGTQPGTDSGEPDATSNDSGTTDSGPTPVDSGTKGDSGTTSADGGDGGPGYTTLQFDPNGTGSPDAIYWDNTNSILYIVDDTNNQVWTYTDANGFQKYAQVPDNPALDDAGGKTKLNDVTELTDGTLLVTRFGYGIGGAIYTVSPDGGTGTVPGVPTSRKRIAITTDPSTGTIYSDSFSGGGGSAISGEIETVDLTTGTTDYATGFGKTVGLLVLGNQVLVADQNHNAIYSVPTAAVQIADGGAALADGGAFALYANIEGPDQLSAGPNGTIFTDQFQSTYDGGGPQVRQIAPDGTVTVLFPSVSFTSLSDVAYDATHSRLFVVDNNGTTVRTIKIFPIP